MVPIVQTLVKQRQTWYKDEYKKAMEIIHLGHSSFKIRSRIATLVTDPFDSKIVGMKFPKVESDIVTVSHTHPNHGCIEAVGGTPLVISGPGEYEVRGIRITGIQTYHDAVKGVERGVNTVYQILVDGISIVHCGDLGHKFDDRQIELLSGADILMIPVGGGPTITSGTALEIITQLEPTVIIPMHYRVPGMATKIADMLAPVDVFLKELGKPGVTQPKLSITKDKLPIEPTVVVLES
jgi:L-ascorbate metabolism protein UlaG (beta-lactamase superfamily)